MDSTKKPGSDPGFLVRRLCDGIEQVSASGASGDRVLANDDGVGHFPDLHRRHADARRVLADLLRAQRLVDADCPERAVRFEHDIRADPADVVGHLLVTDLP